MLVCFGHNCLQAFLRKFGNRRRGSSLPDNVFQVARRKTAMARADEGGY